MVESTARSRRPWLFVPFAAVVLIAIVWSGFWYVAASRADAVITAWLAEEAKHGRIHRCGSRTSGGYPFRIEVRCIDPTVELVNAQPPRLLRGKEVVGVAQVYDPDLIIAEITGPLAIAEAREPAGQVAVWRADWRLAQASLRGIAGTPERLSVVLDGARLERAEGTSAETWAAANRLALHVRRNPVSSADKPVVDVAAQVAGVTVPAAPVLAGRPLDAEVTALVSGLADWRPKPVPARLREWQVAGGRVKVIRLRLQQGDAVAIAVGDIGLSAAGRPDGAFNVTMTGFDQLVQQLVGSSQQGGGLQIGVMAGLAFLGRPAEIDGRRAVSVALRFNDGAVFLGPIPLGRMEPLY